MGRESTFILKFNNAEGHTHEYWKGVSGVNESRIGLDARPGESELIKRSISGLEIEKPFVDAQDIRNTLKHSLTAT